MTAMDFRQYDNALGRFMAMDRLTELAPGITPYRFAFNNPNYWSDPTGLFETREAALAHINQFGLTGATIHFDDYKGVWSITNQGYTFYQKDKVMVVAYNIEGGGVGIAMLGGVGSNSGSGFAGGTDFGGSGSFGYTNSFNSGGINGLQISEFLYSIAGAYGADSFKKGTYRQTNRKTGNFHDRSYKRLSKNAKANYNFAKDLKSLKKAGTVATVVLGSIEISNGIIQDYKDYTTKGHTDGRHTVIASVKVGTGVAVGWAAGAASGAAIGTLIPIPFVGTFAGALIGGYLGYLASEEAGKYMESIYD